MISPAMIAAAVSNGLKFAECMRPHGITAYPDPIDDGDNIQMGPGPDSGIDTASPRDQAAREACVPLLPNGGP